MENRLLNTNETLGKKNSFSVIFIAQTRKLKANGQAPIFTRITVNGEMTHFSTQLTIDPDRWVSREYRTVGQTREEKRINNILDDFRQVIKQRYTHFITSGQVVTATKLKRSILSLDESAMTLMELCDSYISDYEKICQSGKASKESLMRYELTRRRLGEYLREVHNCSDIPLVDINKQMLDKLYIWLCGTKRLCNNTATKFIHRFSSIYRVALDNDWVRTNPFNMIKLSLDKVDRGYLTQDELARIAQKEFATKRLEIIRDIFLFSCYTGFAYVDVAKLTADMIEQTPDGNLWIRTHRQKTNVAVNIRLLDIPKMILAKYKGYAKGDKLLPVPSNQKTNSYLKEIAAVCGIDKVLTFHHARHTLFSNTLIFNVFCNFKLLLLTI